MRQLACSSRHYALVMNALGMSYGCGCEIPCHASFQGKSKASHHDFHFLEAFRNHVPQYCFRLGDSKSISYFRKLLTIIQLNAVALAPQLQPDLNDSKVVCESSQLCFPLTLFIRPEQVKNGRSHRFWTDIQLRHTAADSSTCRFIRPQSIQAALTRCTWAFARRVYEILAPLRCFKRPSPLDYDRTASTAWRSRQTGSQCGICRRPGHGASDL